MTALEARATSAGRDEGIKNDGSRVACIIIFLVLSATADLPAIGSPPPPAAPVGAAAPLHRLQGKHPEDKERAIHH